MGHHIALSVVGTDRVPESGYLRAKLAQEDLIESSHIPYTIVRSTQFFEFLSSIVQSSLAGQTVRLSPAFIQPIASEDVVDALLQVIGKAPINGIIEIAGPERFRLSEIAEKYLKETKDSRTVISDVDARYFGAKLTDNMLIPKEKCRLGTTNFKSWHTSQRKQ